MHTLRSAHDEQLEWKAVFAAADGAVRRRCKTCGKMFMISCIFNARRNSELFFQAVGARRARLVDRMGNRACGHKRV